MSSSFGRIFRVTTFGESHGASTGCIIDGCPANIPIDIEKIAQEMARRRPGQSKISTNRKETDYPIIQSGIFEGKTLGSPIAILIQNKDSDPTAYKAFSTYFRPSHADFTTEKKYGIRDWRGGGRSSARETAARVAAGAVAKQVLEQLSDIEVLAWVEQVGNIVANLDPETVSRTEIEANIVRCPDSETAVQMQRLIETVRKDKDSIGGVIKCVCRNVPAGLGEPVFDKLEAELAKAMLSIPASKGFSIGSGFEGSSMRGSKHNDLFIYEQNQIKTKTNYSGGIQGGISNGMPIEFRVAFKPVATIFTPQQTVDQQAHTVTIQPKGRHDPCVLPRAVPIVEHMAHLVLLDHLLLQQRNSFH